MRFLFLAAFAALCAFSVPTVSAQSASVEVISDTRDVMIAPNDFYRIRFSVTNTGAVPVRGGVFVVFEVPGGGEVVRRVENRNFAVGASKVYRFKELFPAGAPLGTYNVRVSFETESRGTVYDTQTASFTVAAP